MCLYMYRYVFEIVTHFIAYFPSLFLIAKADNCSHISVGLGNGHMCKYSLNILTSDYSESKDLASLKSSSIFLLWRRLSAPSQLCVDTPPLVCM